MVDEHRNDHHKQAVLPVTSNQLYNDDARLEWKTSQDDEKVEESAEDEDFEANNSGKQHPRNIVNRSCWLTDTREKKLVKRNKKGEQTRSIRKDHQLL